MICLERTTTTTTHSITSNYISTPAGYTSNYTSALTLSSPTFSRPGSSGAFFYEVIELSVFITGVYSLRSETMVDTYGYLYEYYFNPRNPEFNLLARDDDSGGRAQFLINYGLHSDNALFLGIHHLFTECHCIIFCRRNRTICDLLQSTRSTHNNNNNNNDCFNETNSYIRANHSKQW